MKPQGWTVASVAGGFGWLWGVNCSTVHVAREVEGCLGAVGVRLWHRVLRKGVLLNRVL